jgi:hypothetical protein
MQATAILVLSAIACRDFFLYYWRSLSVTAS